MADLVLGVAKSLVEGTLSKAQSAIEEESKLRQSTQRDLVFIAGEFHMMQSFLSITTEEHVRNNVVSTWVTQVRDLAYDVEDCIEFIIHLDTKSDWWHRLIRCCNFKAQMLPLDEAVDIIEQLKARVQDVSQRNARYNLIANPGPKYCTELNQPAAAVASPDMLAQARYSTLKQQDLEALTKLITKKGRDLQVISLWGTGGNLEAASIIRNAFEHPKVWANFTCRAWVKLVRPFDHNEFIRSLLNQFYANSRQEQHGAVVGRDVLNREQELPAEDYLIQEFMHQVNNHRYLIVLEDVFISEWNAIRGHLAQQRNGSCIIVSTQQFEVASFCTGVPYFQRLSADRSLCVFLKEGPQTDGAMTDATNRAIISKNEILTLKRKVVRARMDHFPLVARKLEMHELTNYPSKARFDALQVMSVWGVAGVGKSALVRSFYYHRMLYNHQLFDKYGWVDVSHPLNLEDLCRNLLLEFYSHSLDENEATYCMMSIRDPIKECCKLLKDHPCLVIIDDLQSTEEWDSLQAALVSRPSKSIIVVISNEERIALHCADRKDLVFNVKALHIDAAFDLFKKEVHRKNSMFHTYVFDNDVELQQLILKCGGLPKVIVAIADLLAPQTHGWARSTSSMNAGFMQNLEANPEFACLRGLFSWMRSYFRACPDLLRPCIFYLSIFPGYHSIRRRRLVMRWVAEGYSKDSDSCTAEENGEKLFSKLVEMSMVQPPPQEIITHMRMVLCHVSGFFHEYIISRPKDENIVFALEVFALKKLCHPTTQRTGRHLVIEESWQRDNIVFERIDFSRLRSLTVFGEWESYMISKGVEVTRGTQKLMLLHTFGVVNVGIVRGKAILKDIRKLTHLRKLGVSGVSKKNYNVFCSAISGKPRLESLSVWLSRVNQEYLDDISTPPENLQSLKLYGLEKKLPNWIKQLPKLRKLNLEITISEEVGISSILGDLKELCILRLRVKLLQDSMLNFCVMKDATEERSYENVKILEIASCSRLLNVNFGSVAMRNLELLKVGCCNTGCGLQFTGLNHLAKLKEVWIIGSHVDTLKNHIEDQFAESTSKPALKLEEVNLSPCASAERNDQGCSFPFLSKG
ncbi:hypothetical protein PVAP13_8NG262100 [Panicum virgatum]|uniref:Uncharacterized protein n=1 Tax=Panicum virgatum TaxID=38727 RepID=A0A8T0PB00_PANVG|nr:hypothetical protein PVAP13_8NG262100 [Panicum virgatum]